MIEKIKNLTKDTAVYGISTIVGRFLGFLLVPFYTNVFTDTQFGIYSNVYAYLAFFNIVFIYGMDAAYMKFASLVEGDKKKKVFSTPYILVLITTTLFAVVILILKDQFNALMLVPSDYGDLVYYLIGILFFDTIVLIPFSYLRLYNKAKKFAAIKIINIVVNLVSNLVLILKYKMGIEAIFLSNLLASFITFIIILPDIYINLRPEIKKDILIKMLKFGLPYLPASLGAIIVQVIDRPILTAMQGAAATGVYQANYKLGIFMMLIVSMFNYAWQPFFLTNAKEANAKEIFSKVLTLFVTVTGIIWIVIALFIDNIASIEIIAGKSLIGKEFLPGIHIVPIILFAYIFHGIFINLTAGIYIKEKTQYMPLITGLGAAGNIISNLLLIPLLGIMGAAIATFISYFVMAGSIFIISQKYYPVNYEYKKIFTVLILICIVTGIYYYLVSIDNLQFLYKTILLAGFFTSMFVFNIIKINDFKRTVRLLLRKK
jgi:O-antigen/teichoic acid export membrane protein